MFITLYTEKLRVLSQINCDIKYYTIAMYCVSVATRVFIGHTYEHIMNSITKTWLRIGCPKEIALAAM